MKKMTMFSIAVVALVVGACGEQGSYNTVVNPELATVLETNAGQVVATEALDDGTYRIPIDAAKDVLLANPQLLAAHPLGAH